jgi:hypothetical protein
VIDTVVVQWKTCRIDVNVVLFCSIQYTILCHTSCYIDNISNIIYLHIFVTNVSNLSSKSRLDVLDVRDPKPGEGSRL